MHMDSWEVGYASGAITSGVVMLIVLILHGKIEHHADLFGIASGFAVYGAVSIICWWRSKHRAARETVGA